MSIRSDMSKMQYSIVMDICHTWHISILFLTAAWLGSYVCIGNVLLWHWHSRPHFHIKQYRVYCSGISVWNDVWGTEYPYCCCTIPSLWTRSAAHCLWTHFVLGWSWSIIWSSPCRWVGPKIVWLFKTANNPNSCRSLSKDQPYNLILSFPYL